jgi:glycosyltransferase involved in cell wall biosynthesis
MPSLTLAVLCHNNGLYLGELLKSISKQSSKNFELLIIDNASVDDSKRQIEEFQSNLLSLNVIYLAENVGEAGGMREILRNCRTDYVAIIHGDDFVGRDYVKDIQFNIKKYPKAVALSFPVVHFHNDLNSIKSVGEASWSKNRFLNRLLVNGMNPGVMPGVVLNLQESGLSELLHEPFPGLYNADVIFWSRFARKGFGIRKVKHLSYFYRRHSNQSSSGSSNSIIIAKSRMQIIDEAPSAFEKALSRATIGKELRIFEGYADVLGIKQYIPTKSEEFVYNLLNFCIRVLAKIL